LKVLGDAFAESTRSGQIVPLAAIVARLENAKQANGYRRPPRG
jgi:hypothetical protein